METSVLIEGMGLGRPSHQLVSTILHATRGNPLFVQEAMRFLDRSGALEERGGSLVSTVPPAEIHLPGEVLDAIRARIEGTGRDVPDDSNAGGAGGRCIQPGRPRTGGGVGGGGLFLERPGAMRGGRAAGLAR